jgi:uncharacterized protein YwqG
VKTVKEPKKEILCHEIEPNPSKDIMENFNCKMNGENVAGHAGFRTQDPRTISQMLYQLSLLANEYCMWITAT